MTGQAVKTVKSERKGRARIQAALLCFDRPLRRRAAGGLGASELRAGAMVDIGQLPVPMESALTCTALSAAAGSKPLLVTFSISASNAEATSSQVAMAGGALASSSCLPKTATFSTAPIIHGPEMNIGTEPLTKLGSVEPSAAAFGREMPSVK